MRRSSLCKLAFLILLPYIVGWTPPDSSYNEYSFGIGNGQYATYDCAGTAHPHSFTDVGAKVTHKFDSPFRIGLCLSTFPTGGKSVIIPYPDLALDFKNFSLGTTGIRVGNTDNFYGELAILDQIPFSSGRGFLRAGTGFRISEDTHLWLGVNTIPYYAVGASAQIDFPISTDQYIFVNGRSGSTGGVSESGISAGLRIRLH